jgi:hypothetical protein
MDEKITNKRRDKRQQLGGKSPDQFVDALRTTRRLIQMWTYCLGDDDGAEFSLVKIGDGDFARRKPAVNTLSHRRTNENIPLISPRAIGSAPSPLPTVARGEGRGCARSGFAL